MDTSLANISNGFFEFHSSLSRSGISLLETKSIVNSTILDAKHSACFLSADLKDFFLATPMAQTKYMCIHNKYFSITSEPNIPLMILLMLMDISVLKYPKACVASNKLQFLPINSLSSSLPHMLVIFILVTNHPPSTCTHPLQMTHPHQMLHHLECCWTSHRG